MTRPLRTLGATDMAITPIGLGTWALGGADYALGWGDQDDRRSIATIRWAIDGGINWIDTAAMYGLGRSESLVGEALVGVRGRPAVRVHQVRHRMGPRRPLQEPVSACAPADLRRAVEESLRRLGVERARPRADALAGGATARRSRTTGGRCSTLRDEGKMRAAGLSNHGVRRSNEPRRWATSTRCSHRSRPSTARPPPTSSVVRRARRRRHRVRPPGGRAAHGDVHPPRVADLPANDQRRHAAAYTTELDAHLELVGTFDAIAADHAVPVPTIAVAWALSFPGLTGSIGGARTPEQLADWLPALDVELSDDELDHIAAVLERTGIGTGPTRPPRVLEGRAGG